jgi:hypothetical protein
MNKYYNIGKEEVYKSKLYDFVFLNNKNLMIQ